MAKYDGRKCPLCGGDVSAEKPESIDYNFITMNAYCMEDGDHEWTEEYLLIQAVIYETGQVFEAEPRKVDPADVLTIMEMKEAANDDIR